MVPARLVGLNRKRFLQRLAIALLFSASACGGGGAASDAATAGDTVVHTGSPTAGGLTRGIVNVAVQPARITPCSAPDTLTVKDDSGRIAAARKQLGAPAQSSTELFVIARTSSVGSNELRIDDVAYASPEKFDCFTDWQSFDFRATGNNPGWVAEVDGTHVKLERQGAAPAEWNNASRDSLADRILIHAGEGGGKQFELLLEKRRCVNSVSGAYSVWSAQVRTDGTVLKGCSVSGG